MSTTTDSLGLGDKFALHRAVQDDEWVYECDVHLAAGYTVIDALAMVCEVRGIEIEDIMPAYWNGKVYEFCWSDDEEARIALRLIRLR